MQILLNEIWVENRYNKEYYIPSQSGGFEL